MPDTPPESLGPIEKEAVKILSTGAWRLVMFLMTFVVLGILALLVWQGHSWVNTAIAQSPDVVAVHSDLKDVRAELVTVKDGAATAKVAADEAKKAADDTAQKVDATQKKIFEVLGEESKTSQATLQAIATLTERINGVKEQLGRVEEKQDR